MQAEHGVEYARMTLARGEHRITLFATHIGQKHLAHTGRDGPLHHSIFFAAEGLVGNVGMGVDEHNTQR